MPPYGDVIEVFQEMDAEGIDHAWRAGNQTLRGTRRFEGHTLGAEYSSIDTDGLSCGRDIIGPEGTCGRDEVCTGITATAGS